MINSKLNIDTRVRSLKSYLQDFERGVIHIPSFQRDFLWESDDIKELFDSIKNNYPIGSILFWTPLERYEEFSSDSSKIGPYSIPLNKETKNNDDKLIFILDGFQRLSCLFGCLVNPDKTPLVCDKKLLREKFSLYYDLEEEKFIYLRQNAEKSKIPYQVPVYLFANSFDFRQYSRKEFKNIEDENKIELYLERADALGQIFTEYQIASVDIKNATIEEAVEIFRRVNEKGLPLSKDWIVSALTNKDGFRLASEIDSLLEELKLYRFETIKRDIVFQCIQNSFGNIYFDNKIEDLVKKPNFEDVTRMALKSTLKAIKFLSEYLLVFNNKLLPYNSQLIFLVPFFNHIGEKELSETQIIKLKKWFWTTSYSNYFTIYSLSNQRKAHNQFQKFIQDENEDPIYIDRPNIQFETEIFPSRVTLNSVRAKSLVLFMVNYAQNIKTVNTQKVDNQTIEDFEMDNLFSYSKKENPSENLLPIIVERKEENSKIIINSISKEKKPKNYEFLLKEYSCYENLFISEKMQTTYKNNLSKESILVMRKELIIEAEENFVRDLKNILYIKE